jgi:hypothetical protein
MNVKVNNPYLISFTAGGLLYEEFISLYPYLNDAKINSISGEIKTNVLLQTNSQAARQRIIQEVKKRYHSVNKIAFSDFDTFNQNEQKIFLFYTCLKTYSIIFDFIFDVVVEKWLSRDIDVNAGDVLYFLDKKTSNHLEIDQWTATTKQKVATVMIRMLKEVGILRDAKIMALDASDEYWNYFVKIGEPWFLQACLLNKERRDQISHV